MDARVSGGGIAGRVVLTSRTLRSFSVRQICADVVSEADYADAVIFGPDQVPADANALSMHHGRDSVLEDLITYADLVSGPLECG
jgi:hypothetical protein